MMSQPISLKRAEQKVFRTIYNDGLWDIFLGCFFLVFAIAPYLSNSLGDFWSSMVFLPFWGVVYILIWLIRKHTVTPRIGMVKFGMARKTRLARFGIVLLAVNSIALILGVVAALSVGKVPGQVFSIGLGIIFLVGFSIAAYFLDFNRLYVYGLLVGFSPFVGEWLWNKGYVSHHGFPVSFGISASIMILVGLIVFLRLLRENRVLADGVPSGKV
jgi:hypothetical protein